MIRPLAAQVRDGCVSATNLVGTILAGLCDQAYAGLPASGLPVSRKLAKTPEVRAFVSEAYARWRDQADNLAQTIPALAEPEARRRLRTAAEALLALRRIDFFPGEAAMQADDLMATVRAALDARFSKGEPNAEAAHGIVRLDARKFQSRRWATRARPWIDRLACAWLIRRFVDAEPRFVWLDDLARAPRGSVGFDYDGARFTHVDNRVTFEVIATSFGLDADGRVQRIARAVHYLDVGGIPAPDAAGLEAVLGGLREVHADDDRLAQAAAGVFDALYAAPGAAP